MQRRGSPAQPLRPLSAHFLCEKNSGRRAGLITCAGARSGNRAAAAAKLQPCKDRALKSEQHITCAEQRGLSGWSGDGSSTRLSRRELPKAPALPRGTAAPSRRAAQAARCAKASPGSTASRAAKSTCSLTRLQDSREAWGLLKQDLMPVFTNTFPVLWDWEVVL